MVFKWRTIIEQLLEAFHPETLKQWLLVLGGFVVLSIIFFTIKTIVWRQLKTFVSKNSFHWDDQLFDALQTPMRFLVIIIAGGIALSFAPEVVKSSTTLNTGGKVALILAVFWIAGRTGFVFFRSPVVNSRFSRSTQTLFLTIFRILLWSVAGLIVLDTLGISITPLLASLGVGSVAVALALQNTLGNLFSGFYILVDKPIRIGDFVQIEGGYEGHVEHVGWRSTRIKLLANNSVIIPNTKLAESVITNYDMPVQELSIVITVGVSYDSDLEKVEKVTIDVGSRIQKTIEGAVPEHVPFIRYKEFADSSINFSVILRVREFVNTYLIRHEFIKALHKAYAQEGIEIPFPQRVVHMSPGKTERT